MAGIIGIRAEDMDQVDALKRAKLDWPQGLPLIRPSVMAPVLVRRERKVDFVPARFGFTSKFASFNARVDRAATSPMWSKMLGKSHGVMALSYVVEWLKEGGEKKPYLLQRADGGLWMAPALLGKNWEKPGDAAFAIVTREPSRFFARFHDRMIGMVPKAQVDAWLSPGDRTPPEMLGLVGAPGEDDLVAVPADPALSKRKEGDWSPIRTLGEPLRP